MTTRYIIGKNIKGRRQQLGLTQCEFGKRIHRTQCAISLYESGQVPLMADDLPLIASALNIEVADLYIEKRFYSYDCRSTSK